MSFEFRAGKTDGLNVHFKHESRRGPNRSLESYGGLPDALYRQAARSVVGRLIAENRKLRHDHRRRQSYLTTVLAEAIGVWLRRRGSGGGE